MRQERTLSLDPYWTKPVGWERRKEGEKREEKEEGREKEEREAPTSFYDLQRSVGRFLSGQELKIIIVFRILRVTGSSEH